MSRLAAIAGVVVVAFCAACGSAGAPPVAAEQKSGAVPAADTYTPPAAGTTTLVQSATTRRDSDGQALVDGRLLLPAGTRVWVDVYPPGTKESPDPIGRSELYLGPAGSFSAGPFKIGTLTQLHVQFTSHFTRSWQPADVLGLVGLNGMKLPASALRPSNPQAPQSGGYLESSITIPIR